MLSKSCVMLFHDSSTRLDKSDEVPLWVDFGKQISLTVHSFQVITTSSKVLIFCMLETKESFFFEKKECKWSMAGRHPPPPFRQRATWKIAKKMQKGGLKRFRFDKGELVGFYMLSMFCYGWQEVLGPFLVGAVPLLPANVTKIKFQTQLMSKNQLVIPQLLHDVKKTRLFSIKL